MRVDNIYSHWDAIQDVLLLHYSTRENAVLLRKFKYLVQCRSVT